MHKRPTGCAFVLPIWEQASFIPVHLSRRCGCEEQKFLRDSGRAMKYCGALDNYRCYGHIFLN